MTDTDARGSEHIRIKRPPFARSDWHYWVNGIFQQLAKENDGRVRDASMLARMRDDLEKRPDLINADHLIRSYLSAFYRLNRRAISKDGIVRFVPGAALSVGKRVHVPMKQAVLTADLLSWIEVLESARRKFNAACDRNQEFARSRIDESMANPDCRYLGDLEQKLHGYIPSADDDVSHLDGDDDGMEGDLT